MAHQQAKQSAQQHYQEHKANLDEALLQHGITAEKLL
jgi:hypothetical protein